MHRYVRAFLSAAVLCGTPHAHGAAQTGGAEAPAGLLAGTVGAAEGGSPVPFALVTLPDLDRRMFAAADGTFLVSGLPAGRVRLRVEQVGRATVDTAVQMPLPVARRGDPSAFVVRMPVRPVALEAIAVPAAAGECATRGLSDPATAPTAAAVMEALRVNADRYRALIDEYPLRIRSVRTERFLAPDGSVRGERTDTSAFSTSERRRPYVPGAVLVQEGQSGWRLYMPSVYEVAQPAFQEHHCFRYAGVAEAGGRRVHRIEFVPTRDVAGPDVAGALSMDASDGTLSGATFRLLNVPARGVSFDSVTSSVTYRQIRPTLSIPDRIHTTQRLRNARWQGERVVASEAVDQVVDARFLAADPGDRPAAPAASGASHPSTQ
ncbi:MAG: hypothetical protein JWM27_2600 [Gemmatimonadetes bacterium]|nr:hypothetical protein [Gemmatimonadota bacterium]